MSTHTIRHQPKSFSQTFFEEVVLLGPRMMALSLDQLFRGLTDHRPARRSGCCHIPETECPPRCVCEINWEGAVGDKLNSTVRVTNTSPKSRNFSFAASPFQGPGNPGTAIHLSPVSATLAPGQSVVVAADFVPTAAFQAGETYEAEMRIQGAYEQCVCFHFTPVSKRHSHCEVEQGDPPIRVRAHQWYDHFQCVQPCFPPRKGDVSQPHEH